jgi:transcriptional regulator with XRE-family HTH domain
MKTDLLATSGRPPGGWLRALRDERDLSLKEVADRLDVSPQAVHQFEKSEVAGTISLRQLALVAAAMGCRVTYAVHEPPTASSDRAVANEAPAAVRGAGSVASLTSDAPAPSPLAASITQSLLLDNQESGRFD